MKNKFDINEYKNNANNLIEPLNEMQVVLDDGTKLELYENPKYSNGSEREYIVLHKRRNPKTDNVTRIPIKNQKLGAIYYYSFESKSLFDNDLPNQPYFYEVVVLYIGNFNIDSQLKLCKSIMNMISVCYKELGKKSFLAAVKNASKIIKLDKFDITELIGYIGELMFIYKIGKTAGKEIAKIFFENWMHDQDSEQYDFSLPNGNKLEVKTSQTKSIKIKDLQRRSWPQSQLFFAAVFITPDKVVSSKNSSSFNIVDLIEALKTEFDIDAYKKEYVDDFVKLIENKDLIEKYFLWDIVDIFVFSDLLPRITDYKFLEQFDEITYSLNYDKIRNLNNLVNLNEFAQMNKDDE